MVLRKKKNNRTLFSLAFIKLTTHKFEKCFVLYPYNTLCLIKDVRAEKRPHEWLGGVLGV
jgi:hypothetical protein